MHRRTTNNTWHILGVGAVGSLWAANMSASGTAVRLVLSARRLKNIESDSIKLTCESNNKTFSQALPVATRTETISNLLIATKANDVVSAFMSVCSQLSPHCRVVILSNGMGYHQAVADQLPWGQTFAAVCTDGAWLRSQNHVVHAGKGSTKIGLVPPLGISDHASDRIKNNGTPETKRELLAQLKKDLQPNYWTVQTRQRTNAMLLEKLAINSAINGLTAIHNCKNGALIDIPEANKSLNILLLELALILTKAGQKKLSNGLGNQVLNVIANTAENYSSTYSDIKHERASEINYLNGYMIEIANDLAIDSTWNQQIVSLVQALEQKNYGTQ